MPTFFVEKPDENRPLLDYLQKKIPVAPQAYLRQLIKSGKALCNAFPATTDQLLQQGDKVTLPASRKVHEYIAQSSRQPLVLYESESILVVNKPSGLATHASQGHEEDNLTSRVKDMLFERNEHFMTAPAHRLDLPTSGPVIFGKGKKAITALGKMMQEQMIEKGYLALTKSGLPERGVISGRLHSKGKTKYAETSFQALESRQSLSLLELRLHTGRQHQIRKQLFAAGYPIAGDKRYSGPKAPGLNRLFLHCHMLSFTEPFLRQPVHIKVFLPEDLIQFLDTANFVWTDRIAPDDNVG